MKFIVLTAIDPDDKAPNPMKRRLAVNTRYIGFFGPVAEGDDAPAGANTALFSYDHKADPDFCVETFEEVLTLIEQAKEA